MLFEQKLSKKINGEYNPLRRLKFVRSFKFLVNLKHSYRKRVV